MSIETTASIAMGWVYEEAPEEFHERLLPIIQIWREDGRQPGWALWRALLDDLRGIGGYDAELSACRQALILNPDRIAFRIRLGEILHRVGEDAEALVTLTATPLDSPQRAEALALIVKFGLHPPAGAAETAVFDALEQLLLENGGWGEQHGDLIRALAARDLPLRAAAFLRRWTDRWTIAESSLLELGVMAMLADTPALARTLFTPLWRAGGQQQQTILGDFDGTIAAYDEARDTELLRRVEAAFARPEDQLAVGALWNRNRAPAGITVMFLTFDDRELPNDLAWHMGRSAAQAGINLMLYRDSAVVLACDHRASDRHIQERVDLFAAEVERQRPDVVIVDCCHRLTLRGISPEIMAGLRARLGFRLVALMRDAHGYAILNLLPWQAVCDSMVVFEPHAAILAPEHAGRNGNVIALPVMAQHEPRMPLPPPEFGMVFIGSVFFPLRQALLAILRTEAIDFTAVTGPQRARMAPDMAAYTSLLRRSEAVLNIAAHTPEDYLITGRVWETIATGGLLVEQDNPSTSTYLTPYRHYLPWRNLADIVHLAHFIRRHPEIRRRIAAEAHDWTARHYDSAKIWAALLGHATRPLP